MHPEETSLNFIMPPDPSIKIEVEGEQSVVPSLLTGLVIYPAERKFYAVYCGKTKGLKRPFIPGIHRNIPISASINGDTPIRYESPPTIRERLAAANAGQAGK
jgi:hypothetical protein